MTTRSELLWQEIHWPHPLSRDVALGLLRRIAADTRRDPIAWEAWGEEGLVRFFVGTTIAAHHRTQHLIEQLAPGTLLTPVSEPIALPHDAARLRVNQPALSLDVSNGPGALGALLAGLAAARRRGEATVISVVIENGVAPAFVGAKPVDPTRPVASLLLTGAQPASPEIRVSLRDKSAQFRLRATIRLGATAVESTRRTNLLLGMLAGLRTMEAGGIRLALANERPAALAKRAAWWHRSQVLTVEELLVMLAWPVGDSPLPGQPPAHPKQRRPLVTIDTHGRDFAVSTAPGAEINLGIATADSLFHSLFIGPTGSGKSTAFLNLIVRDLQGGKGVVVVDPKADLITSILSRVPTDRRKDVVVLDPTHASPVGLNPLAHTTPMNKELVADGILAVFKDLFDATWGIRTSDVLHASLLTLATHGHASLLWLPRLLTDAAFRRQLTGALDDPIGLESFWAQFEAMSPQQQAQVIGPALSRLRQLLMRPSLRNVLGQVTPKFDLNDIYEKKRILLVPLNKGLVGPEASRLLGSLLVAQLWQLTLARAALSESERHPVSIFIDEMQDYLSLPTNLADALSQSRSLGVAWHLAHQYRSQLSDALRAGVDANARNTIAFGMDVSDATAMARMAPELMAADFMALPRFHVYASLMANGEKQPWVSGRALPPPKKTSSPGKILAVSQRSYGQQLTAADLGDPLRTRQASVRHSSPRHERTSGSDDKEHFGRRPRGTS